MTDVAENDARARLAPPPPEASGDSGASFFFSTSCFFCVCAVGDPQSVELSSTGEHFYRFNDGFDNKLVSFHERYARARRRARERGAATAAEYARSQAAKGGGERDDVARGARDRARHDCRAILIFRLRPRFAADARTLTFCAGMAPM